MNCLGFKLGDVLHDYQQVFFFFFFFFFCKPDSSDGEAQPFFAQRSVNAAQGYPTGENGLRLLAQIG